MSAVLGIAESPAALAPVDVLVIDDERIFSETLALALVSRSFLTWEVGALTTTEVMRSSGTLVRPTRAVVLGSRKGMQRHLLSLISLQHPDVGVVVLLDSGDERDGLPLLARAGARGWATRTDSVEHLRQVLVEVTNGGWWLPRWALGEALSSLRSTADDRLDASFASLTPRERQVLSGLMEGLSRSAIAQRHQLSVNTVRTHVQHMLEKLGVHSCLEAVALAENREPLR
jgi:DNA-binding NarL/FixJ family response regulator